jgi:hypothetical protein
MVVLPVLHDQNKIEVRCNTWMRVLHDGTNAGVVLGDLFQIHLHFDPISAYCTNEGPNGIILIFSIICM